MADCRYTHYTTIKTNVSSLPGYNCNLQFNVISSLGIEELSTGIAQLTKNVYMG